MINTRMEIDGTEEEVQIFDSMFEYLDYYGSDISGYETQSNSKKRFIAESFKPSDDGDFHLKEDIQIEGTWYTRVNWGESEICLIPTRDIGAELWTIYVQGEHNQYSNYGSMIFETEEEAQKKADELNEEE
jgi:hypothetical protein